MISGYAVRVEVHHGQGGRRVGRGVDGHVHPVAVEISPHQPPEAVPGQPAEEGGGLAEPGHGPRDIEGTAAEPRIDVAGRIHNEVDQGLAGNGDHARSPDTGTAPV